LREKREGCSRRHGVGGLRMDRKAKRGGRNSYEWGRHGTENFTCLILKKEMGPLFFCGMGEGACMNIFRNSETREKD
jgi:hypothetical protein